MNLNIFNLFDKNAPKIEGSGLGLYKGGRIRVRIINEDRSYIDYTCRLKNPYFLEIGKRYYMIVERCILRGKIPFICFYFNNPLPIEFIHKTSPLSALDIRTDQEQRALRDEEKTILTNLKIDAEALRAAFTARILKGIYEGTPLFTFKFIFGALVVICIVILVVLQLSGKVDIMGFFGV